MMYKITPELREELSKQWGDMISEEDALKLPMNKVITVGDMVSTFFLKHEMTPSLMIFDYKTERKSYNEIDNYLAMLNSTFPCVPNPAGYLMPQLEVAVCMAFMDIQRLGIPSQIMVMGEEDLASLAVVKHAPIGSILIYGMPGEGMCKLEIDRNEKFKANYFFSRMEKI